MDKSHDLCMIVTSSPWWRAKGDGGFGAMPAMTDLSRDW